MLKRIGDSPKPAPPADRPRDEAVVAAARLADVWKIEEPIRDRADPAKLKAILAAVPDLWVEQFLLNPDSVAALASVLPAGVGETPLEGLLRSASAAALLASSDKQGSFLDRAGLKTADAQITLTVKTGATRTLLIGNVSRTKESKAPPPPPIPGCRRCRPQQPRSSTTTPSSPTTR